MGPTSTNSLFLLRAIVGGVKNIVGVGSGCLVGHTGLFSDNTNIIADGSLTQVLAIQPLVAECVPVTPGKAIFTPRSGAKREDFVRMLSTNEGMITLSLKYRRSGPLNGAVFACPEHLPAHIAARRINAYAGRLAPKLAAPILQQVFIEVLDLEPREYGNLPDQIMSRVGDCMKKTDFKREDPGEDLLLGEWRVVLREQNWMGRISLSCSSPEEVKGIYTSVHGRSICMSGSRKTIDVSSPANPFLHDGTMGMTSTSQSSVGS